jgi:hypothetical protein
VQFISQFNEVVLQFCHQLQIKVEHHKHQSSIPKKNQHRLELNGKRIHQFLGQWTFIVLQGIFEIGHQLHASDVHYHETATTFPCDTREYQFHEYLGTVLKRIFILLHVCNT